MSVMIDKDYLVQHVAAKSGRGRGHRDHDDVVQEGRIILWQEGEKGRAQTNAYLHKAIANRVAGVVTGQRPWTGAAPALGGQRDALRHGETSSIDVNDQRRFMVEPAERGIAMHRREIHRSVRSLPPRQREMVVRRFWLDELPREVAKAMGIKAAGIGTEWSKNIKPKLRSELAHLAELAR